MFENGTVEVGGRGRWAVTFFTSELERNGEVPGIVIVFAGAIPVCRDYVFSG